MSSTSKNTGGKATGIEADASITLRNSSSASGWPLLAISPMFQTTKRGTSRSAVPMYSRRPRWCACGHALQQLGIDMPRDQRLQRPRVGQRFAGEQLPQQNEPSVKMSRVRVVV